MRSVFVRTLILACSLPLAFPLGWCCMASAWVVRHDAGSETSCPRICCGHCTAPSTSKTPPSAPAPLPPGKCPCDERHATAPDAPKVIGGDLFVLAPLPVIDLVPAQVECDTDFSPIFISDRSFQLLHCVWLC